MAHWTSNPTKAHQSVGNALLVVDKILAFAKTSVGKPSEEERALFAAGVAFTYGVWENFIESLAIELTANVARDIPPERVPENIRKLFEKRTAWEISVTPGWRAIWTAHVETQAIGDASSYGLNTAKSAQVTTILSLAGVSDPFLTIPNSSVPTHVHTSTTKKTVRDAIDALVELRGEIVHTGKVPTKLRKGHVTDWRKFIEVATKKMDESCRDQCKALLP
jgi:hypothetical protein